VRSRNHHLAVADPRRSDGEDEDARLLLQRVLGTPPPLRRASPAQDARSESFPEGITASGRQPVNPLLSVEEVAALLRCKPAGIRRWLSQGRLIPVRVGRNVRFRPEYIEALIAKGGIPDVGQPVRKAPRRPQEPRSADDRPHDSQRAPEAAATPSS